MEIKEAIRLWKITENKSAILRRLAVSSVRNFEWEEFSHWFRGSLARLAIWATGVCTVLGSLEFADRFWFGLSLHRCGIEPRVFADWPRIFLAPLLHDPSNLNHLWSNAVQLVLFGAVLLAWGWFELTITLIYGTIASGAAVLWLGRAGTTNHIGASGITFAMFGYIIARGLVTRSPFLLAVSFATLFFMSGHEYLGLFVADPKISVEAHFGGLLGGFFAALTIWRA